MTEHPGRSSVQTPEPADTESGLKKVTANSLSHGSWTLVSRVTGLARVAAIAAVLGPTFLGNTFQLAVLIPTLTYELTGALFPTLLVPRLVAAIDAGDRDKASRIAGGFLSVVFLGLLAITIVGILASPLLLKALSFGIGSPDVAADQQRVGVVLLAILMPLILVYAVVGTAAAVMNAHGRFALPAGAPIVENVGVIATMAAYAAFFGTGTSLGSIGTSEMVLLSAGTLAAACLHAAVQWWGARRAGLALRPRAGWRTPEVRAIVSQLRPTSGYALLNVARSFGVLLIANRIAGGVVAFQFAQNFAQLPMALAGRSVAVALLPRLARLHRDGLHKRFHDEFLAGLGLTFFLAIPVTVGYALLAEPLARAVSFGGMANPTGEALLAASLAALALAAAADAVFVPATSAAYALGDAVAPYRAMLARTVVSAVGMIATFIWLDGTWLLVGLGLSISVGNVLGSWRLIDVIRRRLPATTESILAPMLQTFIVSIIAVVPALVALDVVDVRFNGKLFDVTAIAVIAAAGGLMIVALHWLIRSPELMLLTGRDVGTSTSRSRSISSFAWPRSTGRPTSESMSVQADIPTAPPMNASADDPWFVTYPNMRSSQLRREDEATRAVGETWWSPRRILAYLLIALALAAITGGAGYAASSRQTEMHAARAEVFFPLGSDRAVGFLREDRRLATQISLIESRDLLRPIATANNIRLETLEERVTAEIDGSTEVILLEVRDPEPERALRMTTEIVDAFLLTTVDASVAQSEALIQPQIERIQARLSAVRRALRRLSNGSAASQGRITARANALAAESTTLINQLNILQERLIEARIVDATVERPTVLVNPYALEDPVAPRPLEAAALGVLAGLALGAVTIIMLESRRNTRRPRHGAATAESA